MSQLNEMFFGLVEFALVSFAVLSVGALFTWRLKQPIERVRAIQCTLAAVLVALVARELAIFPRVTLPWFQASTASTGSLSNPAADSATVGFGRLTPGESMPGLAIAERGAAAAGNVAGQLEVPPQLAGRPAFSVWTRWSLALQSLCIFIAGVGAAWFVALWAVGRWRLARLIGSSQPLDSRLLDRWPHWPDARRHKARVVVSPGVCVPMTFGVLRPVILLPKQLAESADHRRLVYCLSHEWAHIRGGDNATWFLVRLLQPLLWFQPLFWPLRRELRLCQDQLADHFAAHGADDRIDYAELLMALARRRLSWHGVPALTMTGRRSSIRRRIELLLSDHFRPAISARRPVVFTLAICMIVAVLFLGAVQLGPAAANDESAKPGESVTPKDSNDDQPREPSDATAAADAESLSFAGTVLDKQTEKPIAGAKVVVRRMILRASERKIVEESEHATDSTGVYHFVIPPEQAAERYMYIELDVEHPDYAWKKGFGYSLTMIRKNLELGDPPFFSRIELDPAELLIGRVVDPNGKPIPEVKMLAYSKASASDFRDYGSFFRTEADTEGRFRINAVKGGPCLVWIVPHDFAPVQLVLGSKRGDQGDIRVERGVSLSGRVLSATGEPVVGVWVNLNDEASQAEIQMPVASAMCRSALTDENGQFKLGPMKPGKCELVVDDYPREISYHQPGRNPAEVEDMFVRQKIEITPDDADRPITMQAVPHVEFHGQYVDSAGQPSTGHDVSVFGQLAGQWFHQSLRPDSKGKIVGRLPHGLEKARLQAITNEHSALHVRLTEGGPMLNPRDIDLGTIEDDVTGVEIIRYQAPIVQIKVVDEEGQAVTDAKVAGVYQNDYELMHPVDGLPTHIFFEKQTDGRFRTSQMLPDTEVAFTAKADGYAEATQTLSLPEETEQEITLVLKQQSNEAEAESTTAAAPDKN